jgi:hypothetical protein
MATWRGRIEQENGKGNTASGAATASRRPRATPARCEQEENAALRLSLASRLRGRTLEDDRQHGTDAENSCAMPAANTQSGWFDAIGRADLVGALERVKDALVLV